MSKTKDTLDPGGDLELASVFDGATPRPRATQSERDLTYAAVHEHWRRTVDQRRVRRRWYASGGLLAAGLVIALALSLLPGAPVPRPVVAQIAMTTGDVLITRGDDPVWRPLGTDVASLSAGTRLRTLEGAARLRIPVGGSLSIDAATVVAFEASGRIAMSQGRVYYDSGARQTSIAIRTPLGLVRNTGTRFSVLAQRDEVVVAVRSGVTVLESARGESATTRAGQRQIWFAGGQPPVLEPIDADDPSFAWADALAPEFSLDGRSALDYLNWVAAETGCELRFATDAARLAARNASFRGAGRARASGETLDLALRSVGLRAQMRGSELIVSRL